ncbi:MAG TPA: MFS transporter [Solirubrobacteraceae bacterium]|jgi:EmrB/QacA subfamily drug resistance transporter|nr:MFS transporter [Solirubrobacteraceae bacterium]
MSPESQQSTKAPHLTATLLLSCLAQFMVILDVSVVNVALPAIRGGLHFSEVDLQWVVNAYTVTFAGFLLLGGRAADMLGRRRVFVAGLALFGLASLAGGVANSQAVLIGARAIQGLGGAVIAPASLSILTTTFPEGHARNRAVGIWGAMGGAGGAVGVLLGGVLTDLLSWRWILFINVPIGLLAALAARKFILESRNDRGTRDFDLRGALSATIGLSLLVLGIVRTDQTGWGSSQTLMLIAAGIVLLATFVVVEGRFARAPLMPLRIYRSRTLSAANIVVLLVGASTFGMWFFVSLYLQQVLGYSPIRAGLAFLPMCLCIVIFSTVASRAVIRVGAKRLLVMGMVALTIGLTLFARISPTGTYLGDMIVPSLLVAIGIGLAFVPATICAVAGVAPAEAGLASGLVNTARLFGGALGLAVLAALATSRTDSDLRHVGTTAHAALTSGFQLAFIVSAGLTLAGGLVAAFGLPRLAQRSSEQAAAVVPVESA